jgi:hypothetical protein
MKYIKTLEKYLIKNYTVYEYKNLDDDLYDYYIDRILDIIDIDKISYEMIYKTRNNIIEKVIDISTSKMKLDNYLKNIIFSSDDLNECISFLTKHLTANKYNL